MKRTPLARKKALARHKRMSPVNRKRKAALWATQYGSLARVIAVKALPSVVSGRTPCVNAHVRSRGAGGTYRDIVPLTDAEHRELHAIGIASFQAKYNVSLTAEAARVSGMLDGTT